MNARSSALRVHQPQAHPATHAKVSNMDAQKLQRVRSVVTQAGQQVRERHPWLAHQNAIGFCIQMGSVLGMAACAALYLQGLLPAWATRAAAPD